LQFFAVSHWELKVDVALHFGNQSPWSSAKRKGDSLPRERLIPAIDLSGQLT